MAEGELEQGLRDEEGGCQDAQRAGPLLQIIQDIEGQRVVVDRGKDDLAQCRNQSHPSKHRIAAKDRHIGAV
jgi:hypothetical protein